MNRLFAFFVCGVILLLPVSFAVPLAADIPIEEREVLIAFYNAANGDEWRDNTGWKEEPLEDDGFGAFGTEGKWYGITVSNDHVTKIEMRRTGLEGKLPPELANLNYLESLSISIEPELTGGIPRGLGNLRHLETLNFYSTGLEGSIPPELGNLRGLRDLRLIHNKLTGSIPPELGKLTSLEILHLKTAYHMSFNKISRKRAEEIKKRVETSKDLKEYIEKLKAFGAKTYHFSGPIPPELGYLGNLKELVLGAEELSGGIPPELGNLGRLRKLWLKSGRFSGSIPLELGNLTDLEELEIYGSNLSGSIPPELGNLTRLRKLSIGSTRLNGPIPFELGNLVRLEKLNLAGNRLSGPIPGELGNLVQLEDLMLNSNRLTGRIPPELGNLPNLRFLQLMDNRLTGPIPMELGYIRTLQQLRLQGNQLSGLIPPNLAASPAYLVELRYNALYTDNGLLKTYLDKRDSHWADTQTVAPKKVTAVAVSPGSVKVSWTPIVYKLDAGGYTVFYGPSAAGPWTEAGTTADKKSRSFVVTGLTPGKKYYFTVQTRTDPHGDNQNTVTSELSPAAVGKD